MATVNRDGYAPQVAIARMVDKETDAHGWRVTSEEHAWESYNESGFIDIVLEHKSNLAVLILECKRLTASEWIFTNTDGESEPRRHARVLRWDWDVTNDKTMYDVSAREHRSIRSRWVDEALEPPSPEANFCSSVHDGVKGIDLNSIASELVASCEALVQEEADYLPRLRGSFSRLYLPLIVTTASIKICAFDPHAVSLDDGQLPKGTTFADHSFVRFTKQLSTRDKATRLSVKLSDVARAKERTIIVVNAIYLNTFLRAFSPDSFPHDFTSML